MPSITSWMRLEPRSRSAEMKTSLQARIYDPLWLLARQWQLGEFQGEDNGSPVIASWRAETARLTRTLGTLLGNGVSLLTALTIVREILSNQVLAAALVLFTLLTGLAGIEVARPPWNVTTPATLAPLRASSSAVAPAQMAWLLR